ncbi:endonuclease V-like isoform X3 [Siniperca chuatsi]|uniref:endonuclease V-like isoform X3 n=1 Tax=Siniperca chuatsi TaxID=119488 RepID=UPI001CE0DE23|nr:endonuclease V-like isoform X3 [Siniperca chuatsi]
MFAPPAEDLVKQWESEQARLRQQVVDEDTEDWQRSPDFSGLERVGGVDLSFIKGDDVNACAHLVVLSYPDLEMLYEDSQMVTLTAPYIAGFLAFRETPFLLEALQRLERNQPQLLPQSSAWRVTSECCQGCRVWAWPRTCCRCRACTRVKRTSHRLTVAPENTFAYTSQLQIHESKNETMLRTPALNRVFLLSFGSCLQLRLLLTPVCVSYS